MTTTGSSNYGGSHGNRVGRKNTKKTISPAIIARAEPANKKKVVKQTGGGPRSGVGRLSQRGKFG